MEIKILGEKNVVGKRKKNKKKRIMKTNYKRTDKNENEERKKRKKQFIDCKCGRCWTLVVLV